MNDGGPAFPHEPGALVNDRAGMTLRDYFAAKAMMQMGSFKDRRIIREHYPDATPKEIERTIAKAAYLLADAMIAEREAKP